MPTRSSTAVNLPAEDTLRDYRAKRNFMATPEPQGGARQGKRASNFVVQKHWASNLHYDFRLELDGTLKSWAVPKGPSLDPKVKRMAVQVEDHPLAYAGFEGTIPAKQYGAGKVIVWDTGRWTPTGDARAGYQDGNLKFELHGHKLRGKWVLVRIKGRSDKAGGKTSEKQQPWLLIKEKDNFVRSADEFSVVDEQPDSVLPLGQAPGAADRLTTPGAHLPNGAVKAALPARLSPQLATLATRAPLDTENWLFEIKFDGYRMLARIDGKQVQLFTRNGHDWSAKLRPLQRSLLDLKLPPGWYDGEIVMPGATGIPDFGALQRCFDAAATNEVVFYAFDLPYLDGHDLRALALENRRDVLQQLLATRPSPSVRMSEVFDAAAGSVLMSACQLGLEGVIAKRRGSRYRSSRSSDWIKLKCSQRQEFVVAGFTDPQGARAGFGALLLGVYDDQGELQHAGKVGSGFSETALSDIRHKLAGSLRKTSPFSAKAQVEGRPHWVEPVWVAEVSFGEWTQAGHIRHAVFRGLRNDKAPTSIVREKPVQPAATQADSTPEKPQRGAAAAAPLAGMRITHPERVIDASTGTTKLDLLRYYALVGPLMMQHLKDRPVSLVRAPAGVDGHLFFQKHAETDKLSGVRQLDPALSVGHPPLMSVASAKGLLSAAQWNVIEFHTMNNGTAAPAHPNRLVFDLDPGEGVAWAQVQEAAQLTRSFLDTLGLSAFLKTSGGKGLHVVVPIRKGHDWDTVKGFSQAVVQHMAKTIPQRFVARSGPKNRAGKIFIDYLRNGQGATTVCTWSARARPGLGISVPLAWDELGSLRGGDHWRVKTAQQRLDTGNEPWSGYARAARGLDAAMHLLGYTAHKK